MSLSVQLLGSALILIAFAAAQGGRMSQNSRRYLGLNVLGSFALGISALAAAQWGFLALEAVWMTVSAYGLVPRSTK
jgi:hypothetical protein